MRLTFTHARTIDILEALHVLLAMQYICVCTASRLRIGVLSDIVLSRDFGIEAVDNGGGDLDMGGLGEEHEELNEQQRLAMPGRRQE